MIINKAFLSHNLLKTIWSKYYIYKYYGLPCETIKHILYLIIQS